MCEWFNWNGNKTDCYLETAKGKKEKVPGGATGPGFCLGKFKKGNSVRTLVSKTQLKNILT